ncbi:hypothetical protein ALC53_03381 [Atta colombica]|uniref:Uncharacterized protein n=1 Tax=Atta colombica TaxID=520822 RepID=A0A195BPR2_9HYME|nr:hypothetical protein ALC53_03381 [Atta colombica]
MYSVNAGRCGWTVGNNVAHYSEALEWPVADRRLGHGSGNIWLGTGHQRDRRGRKDARQVKPMLFCNLRMSSINMKLLSRNIKSFSKRGIDYQDKADMILIYEEAKT